MTDRELTQQVIKGNHNAFATIVHRYSNAVFSKALDMMHSEEGAADVTQQTFVCAYESINAWHGTELESWLSDIAVNIASKIQDEEHRHCTILLEDLPDSVLDGFTTELTYSEVHDARLKKLDIAIATLSKQDQQLLHLLYSEELNFDDIARHTGLSKNNVHVRLYRIRVRLKAILMQGKRFRRQPHSLIRDVLERYKDVG